MRTIIAAALLMLATPVMAQSMTQEMIDEEMARPTIADEMKIEARRYGACRILNAVSDPNWDGNLGADNAQRLEWCAAQPAAVRRKYGSRY